MIRLTKLNGEDVLVNIYQIQTIEMIPESKIMFVNKEYIIVQESCDEIVSRIIDFDAKIFASHKTMIIEGADD